MNSFLLVPSPEILVFLGASFSEASGKGARASLVSVEGEVKSGGTKHDWLGLWAGQTL